jgi:hypothetical protein
MIGVRRHVDIEAEMNMSLDALNLWEHIKACQRNAHSYTNSAERPLPGAPSFVCILTRRILPLTYPIIQSRCSVQLPHLIH